MSKSRRSVSAADVPAPPKTYRVQALAKLLDSSERTVHKLIDSGQLKGHRIPGSRYRKVYEHDLIRFMLEYGLWVPPEMMLRYRSSFQNRGSDESR